MESTKYVGLDVHKEATTIAVKIKSLGHPAESTYDVC